MIENHDKRKIAYENGIAKNRNHNRCILNNNDNDYPDLIAWHS